MASSGNPAIPTDALLGDLVLTGTNRWNIRPQRRAFLRSPPGGRRLQVAWAPAGSPQVLRRSTFSLSWSNLEGSIRHEIQRLLAGPGPFTLILWRPEFLTYRGDGGRTDWLLPWPQAVDIAASIPGAVPAQRFATEARLSPQGDPLPLLTQDSGPYDGGAPPPGEVWVRRGGKDLKTGAPLAAGEILYVDLVPAYPVLQGEPGDRSLQDPLKEPVTLVLEES